MSKLPDTVPLSSLAEITMGQSPDSTGVNETEAGLPFLQGCAEFGRQHPSARLWCSQPLRTARRGSVLVSVRAPVGTTNLADQDYCIGRGLGAVRAKDGISDGVFLLNAIEHNAGYLHRRSQGSTFLAIGSRELAALPVPNFKPEQQRRIAEILGTVDQVIEQAEALIAKQQQVKAGLMHDLFTRGLTPDGQLRPTRTEAPGLYHETPLGWLPKEWAPMPFGQCAASFFLGTTRRGVGQSSEAVPLLKMGDLTWGELDVSDVEPLAVGKVLDERHWLQSGDFLFNTRNTPELVGKTAVYRGEFERCTYDNNLLRVRFKGGLDSRFVCYYMSHGRGQQRVFTLATGTTSVAAIYWSALARFHIPVPSLPKESVAIADRVDTARVALAAETAHLAKLRQLKQGLMQALLTPPG